MCLRDILGSELIRNFLENFKFYSSVHFTLDVLSTREGVFFGGGGRGFF